MRVLQVEDDFADARAVEQMLRSDGHRCETTPLGEEAVQMAASNDYDVVLLDVMLPDIDGYDVVRRLRAAGVDTPIVIQTGLIGRDEAENGPAFGSEDYLIKPFTKSELSASIGAALQRSERSRRPGKTAAEDASERGKEPNEASGNRRRHSRVKMLKSGQVIYGKSVCMTRCLILNLSDAGAAIQPADAADVPDTFVLKIDNGPTHRCQVCWRHADKLGVRFLDAAP